MSKASQNKAEQKALLRLQILRHAKAPDGGIRPATRKFGCSRNTVRKWLRRHQPSLGIASLKDRSQRPLNSPRKTDPSLEKQVIAARKKAPCFGAARLIDAFALPLGKGAAHRILKDNGLVRKRPRKHHRKADLRRIKAACAPFTRFQMDTKYLNDIPNYLEPMRRLALPEFQYTIREESIGAVFLTYASELSKTYATLTVQRLLEHLKANGIDTTQVLIRTDLGSEFDGDTLHLRADGFTGTISNPGTFGATHRQNPPSRPNANADVESVHATMEPEFYDIETFAGPGQFMRAAGTYQNWFNLARKNRSRGNKPPLELLQEKAPQLPKKLLLLPPLFLASKVGQLLSGSPVFNGN